MYLSSAVHVKNVRPVFSFPRLLTICTRHFGSVVAQTIRTYKTDQFPLLLIVMGKRTSNEVLNVIQGNECQQYFMFWIKGGVYEAILNYSYNLAIYSDPSVMIK